MLLIFSLKIIYLKNKLGIKTNEASSFSRQLDLALSDANIKEQQIKQQYASKVWLNNLFKIRILTFLNALFSKYNTIKKNFILIPLCLLFCKEFLEDFLNFLPNFFSYFRSTCTFQK